MIFNRNLQVAVLAAAMLALGARASLVTSNEVVDAVSAWASANGETFTGKDSGTAVAATPTYDDDGATVLYWTVTMSNGGAVIASPDTDLDLVIAVLEKYDGALPEGHPLPSLLKADLRNRLSIIAGRGSLPKDDSGICAAGRRVSVSTGGSLPSILTPQPSTVEIPDAVRDTMSAANSQWSKYGVRKTSGGMRLQAATLEGGDDSPYVRRIVDGFETNGRYTFWDQDSLSGGRHQCFNAKTPLNAVCGCVATAGSAILHFFNCTNDPGVVTSTDASINGTRKGFSTIAGDTDWSILPENLVSGTAGFSEPDDAGYELLGRVAYNVGVLVDMEWTTSPEGSGAQTRKLAAAFKKYGFKAARYVGYSGSETTDGKEFFKTLYAQLWCGAPAVLSIHGEPGGHAVVACGYARDKDGDEFCRVFMGWGGSGDAWYKFPQVHAFSQVNGAVTMIGYEDDAVVPVYGEANIPGIELTVPGYKTNDVPVTAVVDAHGYFGVRVPISLDASQRYIEYTDRGKRFDITPFNDMVLKDEGDSVSRLDLDAAIPNEMLLMILNMDARTSVETARAVASRDGKALLMVSGTPGSDRTVALLNYLYHLDEVTDISNKFVMVFSSADSANSAGVDGDPSIGVFDPDIGSADLRWWFMNGRLSYTNFIVSADSETGEIIYEITAEDTSAVTNALPGLLESGYTTYLRNHSDAVVTVTGVNLDSGSNEPFEIAVPFPAYGVTSSAWTNGERVVFSAPGTFTNEAEGVIYTCVGWATNEVFSGPNGEAVYKQGHEKKLRLFSGDRVTLTWVWQKTHFCVKAKAGSLPAAYLVNSSQYVSPATVWCAVNDRVTIVAQSAIEDYKLAGWNVSGNTDDYFGFYDGITTNDANRVNNGTALSFTVYEPVVVTANYKQRVAEKPDPTPYTVTVTSDPADVATFATLSGSLNWGENTVYDQKLHLAPGAGLHVDATNGVWACTGWIIDGTPVAEVSVDLTMQGASLNVVSVWAHQGTAEPEGSEEEEEEGPTPGPISITALEQAADGSWVITVTGAVKDCWYWLYATEDLANFAGEEEIWTMALEPAVMVEGSNPNPQKAAADGDIVFHATGGSGAALFWRARATSKEDGN